ncbi:hypothetical protein [Microbacterium thalli]|uniref:hypothetical protein n=1 Tax=Microbacterium thalli TaxID=3027921 RepID=UPI0023660734|nr:hypothetical protein [Microbacterium thalli]MDD7930063.1 hypothetical protein [Microbacterium thalli]
MPITSVGYTGSVDYKGWGELLSYGGGAEYGVRSPDDWRASIGGADREVRLTPGQGHGWGVLDRSTNEESILLPPTTSGSRFHLISIRRSWQTSTSAFVSVPGTNKTAIPPRESTPFALDDQPLWLARVDAGKSQVQQLIDLRLWSGPGGALAVDELVLQYLNRLGTVVDINGRSWRRSLSALGTPEWVASGSEAGMYNAVGGGGIILPGATGGAGSFQAAERVPVGSLIQASFSCAIYLPGPVGRPGSDALNYAGFLTLFQGAAEKGRRRWHNHGVSGQMRDVSAVFQWVTTESIPAGTSLNFAVTTDPLSAGGVELWDVHASWSIRRP